MKDKEKEVFTPLKKLQESLDAGTPLDNEFIDKINLITKTVETKSSGDIKRVVDKKAELELKPVKQLTELELIQQLIDGGGKAEDILKLIQGKEKADDEYLNYMNNMERETKQLAAIAEVINLTSEIDELLITIFETMDGNIGNLPSEFIAIVKDRYSIANPLNVEDYRKFLK